MIYYSFEIGPTTDINFGHQQIFSTKKEMIDIKNTGKFPFSYTIIYLKPEEYSTHMFSNKQNKNDKAGISKASKSSKGSKKDSSKKSKESKDNKK